MNGLRTAKTKIVMCTHCGGPNEVAARAMSVFCAHCRKRLILENYVIKSYQAVKGYATCGDVSVEKRGRVAAPIQSNSLTVKGKVHGKVEARGKVEVTSTGSLEGSLRATSLIVVKGASFDGYCEIRPAAVPAIEPKPAELTTQSPTNQSPTKARQSNGVRPVSTTQAMSSRTASSVRKVAPPPAEKTIAEPAIVESPPPEFAVKKATVKKATVKKVTTKKAAAKSSSVEKITTKSASKSADAAANDAPAPSKPSPIKAISTRRKAATPAK